MKIRNLMAPVVALAVCGTVATAQAQQPTSNGRGAKNQGTQGQDTNRYQNQDSSQNRTGLNQQNDARAHVDKLLEGITLTAQQRTKVDSIVQKFGTAQPGGMNQGSVTDEPQDTTGRRSDTTTSTSSRSDTTTQTSTYGGQTGVQQNANQQFSQLDAQVRAVLTPEQQNIWDRNVGTLRNQGNPKK